LRVERVSNRAPRCDSKSAIFRLTVGSGTFILRLAADKLPTSTASTSIAMASSRSMRTFQKSRGSVVKLPRYSDAAKPPNSGWPMAPIALGTRAFELLLALMAANGSLVSKQQLYAPVWPGTVVAEENSKVQVFALRRALGEDRDFIRTEVGRGYRFIAAVRSVLLLSSPRRRQEIVPDPSERRECSRRLSLRA